MGGVVADWSNDRIEGFEKAIVRFRHTLAERPLFSDAGLIGVLNRYPRDAMGIFTMGEDLEDWQSWRRGTANGLDGAALLEAVRQGRLWLNLRHANRHLPEFAALCDEISAEKEKHLKTRILNRDLGLLISSPNARVFYHLDVPLSSLWQVRGVKRIWFYPRGEPFTDPAWLERCVHGVAEGQMPFSSEWDAHAATFELTAGDNLVAAHFGARQGGWFHPWISAYDPDYSAHSPGTVHQVEAIGAMTGLGLTTYDLGPGEAHWK